MQMQTGLFYEKSFMYYFPFLFQSFQTYSIVVKGDIAKTELN